MRFGDNLRNVRIQRHLTQQQLADDMKMSQASIAAYEKNIREPSFDIISKFSEYFHISPYTLLPFGDVMMENESIIIGEQVQANEKLLDLFEIIRNFNDADLDALLAVANSLKAKY